MIDYKLNDVQLAVMERLENQNKMAVFVKMGIGKTLLSLHHANNLQVKTLVIAPLLVANTVWAQEIEKFGFPLSVSVCTGAPKKRLKAISDDSTVTVINRENLVWLQEQVGFDTYDLIIVDESTSFKSPSSKRTKALLKFKSDRIILLSGTPVPRSVMDLFSQMKVLDGGKALGKTLTAFRSKYMQPHPRVQHAWMDRQGSMADAQKLIPHLVYSNNSASTGVQLNFIDVDVSMSPKAKKVAKGIKNDQIAYVGDEPFEVDGAENQKYQQLANGFIKNTETEEIFTLDTNRLDHLETMLDDINEPVLLIYGYNHVRDEMLKRFKKRGVEVVNVRDAGQTKRWNEGKIPILMLHPQSAGHGLNLQYGGSIMIWVNLTYDNEVYQQAIGRLYRQGQTETVRVVRIYDHTNGVEKKIVESLNVKELVQEGFIDFVSEVSNA